MNLDISGGVNPVYDLKICMIAAMSICISDKSCDRPYRRPPSLSLLLMAFVKLSIHISLPLSVLGELSIRGSLHKPALVQLSPKLHYLSSISIVGGICRLCTRSRARWNHMRLYSSRAHAPSGHSWPPRKISYLYHMV